MKSVIIAVTTIALSGTVFGQVGQYAQQRFCGSQLDFMEMQRTDPERYQRFMDFENQLQNQILNSMSIPTGTIYIPVVVHVVHNPNNPVQRI
ncbi:MAG: hypothetical protein LBG28_03875 [Tannerella sp.]|jgi:hypothetical protein|nr:hypothetical protein [Tannerella sp.]